MNRWTRHGLWTIALSLCLLAIAPQTAFSFCGTYLSDANEPLYNDATQVALMRSGTKTVLSMANTYEGPVKDFAMVVPVPVVLQQDQVKTLTPETFERLDRYSAPRLVAYQEKNPCVDTIYYDYCYDGLNNGGGYVDMGVQDMSQDSSGGGTPVVTVEAEFAVGEYDIVVLSAQDSTSLQTWLTSNFYKIPQEAGPVFDSYIAQGMYFFVAKINASRVTYDKGRALLSPLRFQYESPSFSLPVRLGMVNSKGEQDLIIYILAENARYEAANYPNANIPTNLNVKASVQDNYAEFYEGLFAKTLKDNPNAIITEHAWGGGQPWNPQGGKCDPCPPTPPLPAGATTPIDYNSLGGDYINAGVENPNYGLYVLTRLHARYTKEALKEDIVFKKAPAIIGGVGTSGKNHSPTTTSPRMDDASTFQGRYIIHNRWQGDISCDNPVRYRWGASNMIKSKPSPGTLGISLENLAPAPNFDLQTYLDDVPQTQFPKYISCNDPEHPEYSPNSPNTPNNPDTPEATNKDGGCAQTPSAPNTSWALLGLAFGLGWWRRRRKRHVS